MINLKDEFQNYPPINLKAIVEAESEIPDGIKSSIVLYNKAIDSLKMGSEDIAIIELKKAISINPNFYEAMNLLGLCYIYVQENAKAAEMFNEVIAAENNSVKALGYLNKLSKTGDSSLPDAAQIKKTNSKQIQKGAKNKSRSRTAASKSKNKYFKTSLQKYVVGFVLGAVITFSITMVVTYEKEPVVDIQAIEKQYNEKIKLYESKYDDLQKEYENLQGELDIANSEIEYNASVVKLYEIESMFSNNKLEEAADMLLLMKTVDFRSEEKEFFNNLYDSVMPVVAERFYNKGKELNRQGKYQEAIKNLEKISVYMENYERMDSALYYTGKSYQGLEDFIKAKSLYNKIISEYPESNEFVYWAKIRLNEIP